MKTLDANNLSGGTVHAMTSDWQAALNQSGLGAIWGGLTPLARNEWICWVSSAKQAATKTRRVKVGISKLQSGMRRPCCWAGCPHRKTGNSTP